MSEIVRTSSSSSVASQASDSTNYSYDCDPVWDEELALQESLSQQASSSTQPTTSKEAAPSASKRKRDEWFDIADSEPIAPGPAAKLPKKDATSSFSSSLATSRGDVSPEEELNIIAFNTKLTSAFPDMPTGFWWEIARLFPSIANGSEGGDKLSLLNALKSRDKSNAVVAAAITDIARGRAGVPLDESMERALSWERAAKIPWEELDKEDHFERHALNTGNINNIYFWEDGADEWYGGKVHFVVRLASPKESSTSRNRPQSSSTYILEEPTLASSTQFSRRFGSKRFMRLRVSDALLYNNTGLVKFCKRPFIFFSRVFRAFYAKAGTVFLVQTDEVPEKLPNGTMAIRPPSAENKNPLDMSFLDFVQWHNPLEMNANQHMAKYASRFALGLSNSVPGLKIAKANIFLIKDIVASPYSSHQGDAPSEAIMTDGCGLANGNFFAQLNEKFHWRTYPTAIQVRINGAKGLLAIHPKHATPTADKQPVIWIRESQLKISYPAEDTDLAHYTVDILRSSYMASPSQLSTETIINLAENGVPPHVFQAMIKQTFEDKVAKLTTWDGEDGLYKLWRNVCREGSVIMSRLARQNVGSARARGYIYEDLEQSLDDNDLVEEELAAMEKSTAWWEDPVSGQPSSLEETCLGLLDAGFSPASCLVLRMKLADVARKSLTSLTTKYHIKVPMSCTAFVIPDPLGVLEPGQCQVKFSSKRVPDANGSLTDTVLGPVLLTRHPCKVPTDVQKAEGVFMPQLSQYCDVIVVSTKGHLVNGELLHCHLASMTGGGDYDGDLMSVFWQPELVEHFKCADKRFAKESECAARCITKEHESAQHFLTRVPAESSYLHQISEVQTYLLAPLSNPSIVGKYSTYWENSIYMNGYQHSETIRLAQIFCAVLDGIKTGVSIKSGERARDSRQYEKGTLEWKVPVTEKKGMVRSKSGPGLNLLPPKRGQGLPVFIMDVLKLEVKAEYDRQCAIIEQRLGRNNSLPTDEDLRRPWEEFKERAKEDEALGGTILLNMQKTIEKHVQATFDMWKTHTGGGRDFTALHIIQRQDRLRSTSRSFATTPIADAAVFRLHAPADILRLKASYAYVYGCRENRPRFPFDVAFRQLCAIKAQAVSNGTERTVACGFYTRMDLHKAYLDD